MERLYNRFGRRRMVMIALLLIVGLASGVIRLLARYDFDHTAMLYLAVPYGVAVMITLFRPYRERDKWWQNYISHSVSALVVFLASSIVLFEGFICVLFFMPIYFLCVTLVFIGQWMRNARKARNGASHSLVIPILIGVLSMEGTAEVTTFDRHNSVTSTRTTSLSPDQLLHNLATPFSLPTSDDWMLGLFPMPYAIEAGSLNAGDVHRVFMRYHRWFITNTHEGVIELRIESVSPELVTVSFIRDTSYLSTYVNLTGSEIRLVRDDEGITHVSLTVRYERRLDPAWYFQPIQQYAIKTMAAHLIKEVVIRD